MLSKLIIEIPLTALFPTLFIGSAYYICGFNSGADNYFLAIFGGILSAIMGVAYGFFFSIVFKSERLAFELAPLIFVPFLLVGGQVINPGNLIRESDPSSQSN